MKYLRPHLPKIWCQKALNSDLNDIIGYNYQKYRINEVSCHAY